MRVKQAAKTETGPIGQDATLEPQEPLLGLREGPRVGVGLGGPVPRVFGRRTVEEVLAFENAINQTGKNQGQGRPPETMETFVYGKRASGFYLLEVPLALLNHEHDPDQPDHIPASPGTAARIAAYAAAETEFPPLLVSFAQRKWPNSRGGGKAFVANGNHRAEAARCRGDLVVQAHMPKEDFDFWAEHVLGMGSAALDMPVRTVDRPEFRAWFHGSKVVDAVGQPRLLFHGTAEEFSVFRIPKRSRGNAFDRDSNQGVFLTGDPEQAAYFAFEKARAKRKVVFGAVEGDRILGVYAVLRNPMEVDYRDQSKWKNPDEMVALAKAAKAQGCDGLVLKGIFDAPIGKATDLFVVFNPTQIKSAFGNCGRFDPEDPDIRG